MERYDSCAHYFACQINYVIFWKGRTKWLRTVTNPLLSLHSLRNCILILHSATCPLEDKNRIAKRSQESLLNLSKLLNSETNFQGTDVRSVNLKL